MSENATRSASDTVQAALHGIEEFEPTVLRAMSEEPDLESAQIIADAYNQVKGGLQTLYVYFRKSE